jgi:hypothetical protein
MNIIRAIRADLQLKNDVAIDCYLYPNGDREIGITGASLSIGRSKEYLGRLHKTGGKALQALQDNGYTGCINETEVTFERGATRVKTISIQDFIKLVTYDAIANRRSESIALLAAFADTGLEKLIDDLFNGIKNNIQDKIAHYTTWTNEELQMALLANYDDWKSIEEQESFLMLGQGD